MKNGNVNLTTLGKRLEMMSKAFKSAIDRLEEHQSAYPKKPARYIPIWWRYEFGYVRGQHARVFIIRRELVDRKGWYGVQQSKWHGGLGSYEIRGFNG